jgi:small subunit ribosomal protein S21
MYNKSKYHQDVSGDNKEAVKLKFLEVKVIGDFDESVRRFKTYFQRERIVGQLKEREAFEKPSDKKRRKQREARQRALMLDARAKMIENGEWEKHKSNKEKKRTKKIEAKNRKQSDDLDGGQ